MKNVPVPTDLLFKDDLMTIHVAEVDQSVKMEVVSTPDQPVGILLVNGNPCATFVDPTASLEARDGAPTKAHLARLRDALVATKRVLAKMHDVASGVVPGRVHQ